MKQLKKELNQLIKKYGYWSEEVFKFNSNLDFNIMSKLNNNIKK